MLDWLLNYPWGDFERGKLILAASWPSPAWLAFLTLAGGVLIAVLAWRRRRTLGLARISILCALQWAMLALVMLALAQPSLVLRSLRSEDNAVAVLLDNSASMHFVDGGFDRQQMAQTVLDSAAMRSLQKNYSLQRYYFDAAASSAASFATPPAPGSRTDIGDSVLQVLQQLRTVPLGAIVVISDGADSAGTLSEDTLNRIASFGVPVHTIGIGRERMPEDLELQEAQLPERALPDTSISARVAIRHDGAGSTRIKVFDGERFIADRTVELPAGSAVTTVSVPLTLSQAGEQELRFTLDPKVGEQELRNNTRTRLIDVSGRQSSVLYVEGEPRWEFKFMRRALDHDPGVRLTTLLRTSTNGYYRQGLARADELADGFPTNRAQLYAYDALIVGSIPAAWFTPEQLQMIHDFVSERGGTLLMLAGPNGLGDGGWGNSAVGGVLPTALPAGASFHRVRVPASPTLRGRATPMLQFSDDPAQNQRLWQELPPLEDYQDLGAPRLAATTWLSLRAGEHEQPLFVGQPYGRGRSMILATGGTWRWRMGLPSDDHRHEQFWRQLMRALVADVPTSFQLSATVRGSVVQLRAEVRDASFKPQDDVVVRAVARSPDSNDVITLLRVANQPGVYQADYSPSRSASYVIEATAERGDSVVGAGRTTVRFEPESEEFFSLRQNRPLLQRLAEVTGGRYWQTDSLSQLPAAIRASPAGIVQQQVLPLWNAPLGWMLLLGLKALEWLLRRRWGVV